MPRRFWPFHSPWSLRWLDHSACARRRKLFVDPGPRFLDDIVQAARDLLGFFAVGIRREYQDTVDDTPGDERSGQPAKGLKFLAELAEHGDLPAAVRDGV